MHHTAAKQKKLLARITVLTVLLNCILHRLFGQAVLEFKGGNRQAIDKKVQIERPSCFVGAVA